MKYIDAEKLIAKIARLRKEHTTREYRDEAALVLEDLEDYVDSLQQEQPEVDLEEAAKKYSDKYCSDWAYRLEYEDAFLAGAEWQKEQLLKEAVEGEVCILPSNVAYVKEKNNESLKQHLLDNFKAGDKVKIIIVKEDGQ